jgi:dTDP-glucose pyrophosphorylase
MTHYAIEAVAGISCYTPAIFEGVHAIKPSERGELEISDDRGFLIDLLRSDESMFEALGQVYMTG